MTTTDSTTTVPSALEELKAKQQQIWSSGDYGKIAWITVPLARELVDAVDLRSGAKVLDVACGTGHAAIEAARAFCDVSGIDYVPALVEIARRRAAAEGLQIDLREADAEQLPFADNTFDVVLSAIGVMFTADHARAAAEVVRVTRGGGRIGLASWTPTGFVGRLLKIVGSHVPPPPAAQAPTRWGADEAVRDLLGSHVRDVSSYVTSVTERFGSPEHFADFFLSHYGPTRAAACRLDEAGRHALREDMIRLAHEFNTATDATFVADWDYLVVTAEKC